MANSDSRVVLNREFVRLILLDVKKAFVIMSFAFISVLVYL